MPEIPECLHRRYRALDELIGELSSLPHQRSHEECFGDKHSHDPGIKLMCDFWNILKEDPDCNLTQAVKQRMGLGLHGSGSTIPRQKVTCYMAGRGSGRDDNNKKDAMDKIKDICCGSESSNRSVGCPTSTSKEKAPEMPLTKALCNLKEAATLDKKCNVRVMELMETQKELKAQIHTLEQREKEGVALLKEADCMWSCMEEEYKKKIADSIERQKELMKQLREVEKSNNKWRKNKKELEDQLKSVGKCRQEMNDKTMQKKNDLKVIEMEMTDFNKRIATNKRLADGSKQVLNNKRTVSDKKVAGIAVEVTKLKNTLTEVQKYKKNKEEDGQRYVKEARDDLQKICKTLLQKKIENEDILAEKEAILQEIDLLKQACDQCKDKCQLKRTSIEEEIKKVDKDIGDYRFQCVQCHQCVDTADSRKLCSDCPKCKEQRECITLGDHCDRDPTYDCVCIGIKEKFLNNVFENMYTIMERHSKTKPGKALADSIVRCLKNSRNGKLNAETRQQVQEFVLNTVKKNLNLTIVGGAVKTRCEMDADTYKQLMLCLKQVKAEKPPKEDKGTVAKKESCRRWGGASECNCPGGAKYCACTRRAPPPPRDPSPCPPVLEKEEDSDGVPVVLCPHKESVGCGPNCAMHAVPSAIAINVTAAPKPSNSCATSACPFKKNMRAAQCVLGPESLSSLPQTYMSSTPYVPEELGTSDRVNCRHGGAPTSRCMCIRDHTRPRDKMIEEVMGRYTEVTPIEKVRLTGKVNETNLGENTNHECKCNANASKDGISQICDCSSDILLIEGTDALIDMLRKKNLTHVCKTIWNRTNSSGAVKLIPKPESAAFNKDDDARVHVILHPKFHLDKTKCHKTSRSPPSCSTSSYSKRYENTSNQRSGGKDFCDSANSKRKVDDNIKSLLKDVMMSDMIDDDFSPNVKWMNVDSLIKLMPSQSDVRKHKNNNVADSAIKPLQKVKKPVKYYDHNLKINPKPNKQRPPKISEFRNNNFSSYHAKLETRGKQDKAFVQVADQDSMKSSAAIDNTSKCYVKMKEPDHQLKYTKQLKADYSNNSTFTTHANNPMNDDVCHGFPLRQKNNMLNEPLSKHKLQNQMTSNISSQAMALAESVCDIDNSFKADILLKKTIEIQNNIIYKPEIIDKNIQIENHVSLENLKSGNFSIEVKEKLIDIFDTKFSEHLNSSTSFHKSDSEHSIHFYSKNRKKLLLELEKDNKTKKQKEIRTNNNTKIHKISKSQKPLDKSYVSVKYNNNKLQSIHNQNIIKLELQQKYQENKTTSVKLVTETGKYKVIKAPVTKTLSGNIAADINKLCNEVEIKNKQCDVTVARSDSGAIILNKHKHLDSVANAVIRMTASGSFLLVMTDSVFQSSKIVKKVSPPVEKFYKVKINTNIYDTTEPPAVLKATPSNNYLVVPDKEYENQYRETIEDLLEDSTEYYVNLNKIDSENCVIKIDNSWAENEPNALVVKTVSGDVKILTRRNAVISVDIGRKRTSITSSSKVLFEIVDKLPRTKETTKSSKLSKRPMIATKSSSDSNIYEKVKLFYSDHKDLSAEPSAILKMSNSGQHAVILDKESKSTLIKNLRSYLKNNCQGLIPIKKTDTGEITIALNGEQTDKTHYGSLKITPSGNLYVIVDKKFVEDITEEEPLRTNSANNSITNVTSRHIIGKLQRPVNKAVTTTCNALPENDCDMSKCVCADIQFRKIDWVLNPQQTDKTINYFKSQVCGIDWRKVTSSPDSSYIICDNRITENCCDDLTNCTGDTKALPHIIIKPCTCQPLLNSSHVNQQQCFYVIEAVCPFNENMPNWSDFHVRKDVQSNSNWDSLTFLPPQLPDFLKDVKYK